jgi:hypothetical protein
VVWSLQFFTFLCEYRLQIRSTFFAGGLDLVAPACEATTEATNYKCERVDASKKHFCKSIASSYQCACGASSLNLGKLPRRVVGLKGVVRYIKSTLWMLGRKRRYFVVSRCIMRQPKFSLAFDGDIRTTSFWEMVIFLSYLQFERSEILVFRSRVGKD